MSPHGQHSLGVILALPGLECPWEGDLAKLAFDLAKHERVIVARYKYATPGWRNIAIGFDVSRGEAIAIAKRHMQNCDRVVVLDSLEVPDLSTSEPLKPQPFTDWAPTRPGGEKAWEGKSDMKPWDFACEVSMPHLDSMDTLPTVIALLRAQSIKPFISIVDCGSRPEVVAQLEAMRAPDFEVHYLRFNGVRHSSDFPAASLDLAFSICRSPVLVTMHTDVFLRQQTSLQQLVELCDYQHPAVGFQMTPRDVGGWEDAITHSFAAFNMACMDDIGAGWSLRRAARLAGRSDAHRHHGPLGQFMDTETCLALVLREHEFRPMFVGTEANFEMTAHSLMRHVRTLTGARLYSPAHKLKAEAWLKEALNEAATNLEEWAR